MAITLLSNEDLDAVSGGQTRANARGGNSTANGGNFDITATRGGEIGDVQANGGVSSAGGGGGNARAED